MAAQQNTRATRRLSIAARIWAVFAAALSMLAGLLLPGIRGAEHAWLPWMAMLLVAVGAGLAIEMLILHWIRLLTARVAGTPAGTSCQPLPLNAPSDIAAVDASVQTLVQKRLAAEHALEEVSKQNEALLREVHHRVKNSMQIVASLLSLHAGKAIDPARPSAFDAAVARINALAFIHHEMYAEDNLREIDVCTFLTRLLARGARGEPHQDHVRLADGTAAIAVSPTVALPLGMLVLELVQQAGISPESPAGSSPAVSIALASLKDGRTNVTLRYPASVPEWMTTVSDASLGQTLVAAYVRQLKGQAVSSINENQSSLSVDLPGALEAVPA